MISLVIHTYTRIFFIKMTSLGFYLSNIYLFQSLWLINSLGEQLKGSKKREINSNKFPDDRFWTPLPCLTFVKSETLKL